MRAEQLLLIGLTLLGAAFVLGGQSLTFRANIGFGPGFIPVLAGVSLALSCVLQLMRRPQGAASALNKEKVADQPPNYRALLITLAILVLGTTAMELGSVLLPVFLIIALLSRLVAGHNLIRTIIVATTTITAIYLIFSVWLGLPVN
ncbi:tripartite tricarboxylate transporter TctB family protein [Halomonas sp. AOP5-B2-8]